MSQIQLQSTHSALPSDADAAEELVAQLTGETPKLVVVFAAHARDQWLLNRALRERLPASTRLIGATTAGEINNTGLHSGSVVMAALSGDFEIGLGLGRDLTQDAMAAGSAAMAQACAELGTNPEDLDLATHVGLVIDDGHRYKKEELLLGALERNQGVVLVGGGAADPGAPAPDMSPTARVHVDGEVVTDAVLVAMFHTEAPWAALRSHGYTPTGEQITITRVDPTHQRALEIDGQPAAAHYAALLGVDIDDLEFGKPNGFARRSLAVRVGSEYFIRSPWKPLPDGSILFANYLNPGDRLELMELGDMGAMTRAFLAEELPRQVRNPQGALLFNCSGRSWLAQALGTTASLSDAFVAAPPCAGCNVHFEIFCGFHINTTLTALAFGSNG